jgi:hypothetical protein
VANVPPKPSAIAITAAFMRRLWLVCLMMLRGLLLMLQAT